MKKRANKIIDAMMPSFDLQLDAFNHCFIQPFMAYNIIYAGIIHFFGLLSLHITTTKKNLQGM